MCSFYSAPDRGANIDLVNHLTLTLNNLLNLHKDAGIIIAGDRNHLDISSLLSIEPSLRQLVTKPTLGAKILDVVCTNLHGLYQEPTILPPLTPDDLTKGAPSDHFGIFVLPKADGNRSRQKTVKYIRPMPSSLVSSFKDRLSNVDFQQKFLGMDADTMSGALENITSNLFNETFPEKKIMIYSEDKPWFNEELRNLKRKRLREYEKHGKSAKYLQLEQTFSIKVKEAVQKYMEKIKVEVSEGKRGSAYPTLKRLAKRPETNSSTFSLPYHCDSNLTALQTAEILADHFSRISCEFEPLSVSELPPNVVDHLNTPDARNAPYLSLNSVYYRIQKAKKPNGVVPGDLPKKLVKECALEIAKPAQIIFNSVTRSSSYPSRWKTEHQIPIPKVQSPESEDDLRNIAKTPFLSKVYESFLAQWLLSAIKPYLDPSQCGLKGSSINHYLIKLLHFIQQTLDQRKPSAVLVASVDLSKGFNRVDHSLVIQDLYDMHTPSWLLRIIFSYLTDRTMTLTYKGAQSSAKQLHGGTPQGALLGGIIFIIKFNGALIRPAIPRNSLLYNVRSETVKYIDDGSAAATVDMKTHLVTDESRPRPHTFAERTCHALPPEHNLLQNYIHDVENFTANNKMKINKKKTTVMKFTNSRKYDFPLEVQFADGSLLETTEVSKMLGVMICSNLKWKHNTNYICSKARRKVWLLRRLQPLGLSASELYDVYTKEVHSILEYAVPVWHYSITKREISEIEAIQKLAFRMILGRSYGSYASACAAFSTESLEERRRKICQRFALKNVKSNNCLFTLANSSHFLRNRKNIVQEYKCNTARFQRSSLPSMSKFLNSGSGLS